MRAASAIAADAARRSTRDHSGNAYFDATGSSGMLLVGQRPDQSRRAIRGARPHERLPELPTTETSNCNVRPAVQIAVLTSILQQEGLPCVYHSFLQLSHSA
jgi:hypothetical protein